MSPSTAVVMLSPVVHPSGLVNGPPAAETSGVKVLAIPTESLLWWMIRESTRVYTSRVGEALTAPGTPVKDRLRRLPVGRSKRVTTRPSTFTAPLPSLYSAPQTTLSPLMAGPADAMPL